MNFFRILLITFIIFFLTRLGILLLYKIISVISKKSSYKNLIEHNLSDSITFLIIFIIFYIPAVEVIKKTTTLSNFDWYLIFTFIGITCVLWIYFKWEFSMFFPRIDLDEKTLAIKKIIIFTMVMLISFVYGYAQILKLTDGKEIEPLTLVANYTIIPGIIALDRVMNQVISLIKIEKSRRENMIKSM